LGLISDAARRITFCPEHPGVPPVSDESVITLIGVLGLVLFFVVVCGLPQDLFDRWAKARAAAANTDLKKSMVERGFTPDEIVRVINAGSEDAADEAATEAGTKVAP
jgi:hypothetical protein